MTPCFVLFLSSDGLLLKSDDHRGQVLGLKFIASRLKLIFLSSMIEMRHLSEHVSSSCSACVYHVVKVYPLGPVSCREQKQQVTRRMP